MLTISDQENGRLHNETTSSLPPKIHYTSEYSSNLKDVLRVWLNGGVVQYRLLETVWRDYDESTSNFNLLSQLHYYEWRIKPQIQYYRLAIVKNSQGIQIVAVNDLQSAEKLEENPRMFVKWLTGWQEYTIEN